MPTPHRLLHQYSTLVGKEIIAELITLARRLAGEHIVMVNSTPAGGGVAEILNSIVILMNELGVTTGWRILKGSDEFFRVTKTVHNGLQSEPVRFTKRQKILYEETNARNAFMNHFNNHDLVIVHDPQPLPLIRHYKKHIPWIWQAHIDLSKPDTKLLEYLKPFIEAYDAMIVSIPDYRQPSLALDQVVITPAIDPLTPKNSPMKNADAEAVLRRRGIKLRKPVISQISRYDKWKNPIGAIRAYREIRKVVDCQLVLMGNMAMDDPDGPAVYKKVLDFAGDDPDITLLLNCEENDRTVNALQRLSAVVFQLSTREGFGLAVAEAMWKGTPVIGTKVGGITRQIVHGKTGYLVKSAHEAVKPAVRLLKNAALRTRMGRAAREHVREHFLVTRLLRDYLLLADSFLNSNYRFRLGK